MIIKESQRIMIVFSGRQECLFRGSFCFAFGLRFGLLCCSLNGWKILGIDYKADSLTDFPAKPGLVRVFGGDTPSFLTLFREIHALIEILRKTAPLTNLC